jgi:prophage tail gpP-like protein
MRLARERGLLLLETPSGDLQITRLAQPGTAVATLQRGARPLKRLRRRRDVSERHAHYHVRGQSADDFALEVGVLDLWSGLRNRTLRIDHDRAANREACERRALWEAMTRAGKSIRYTADLYGWRVDPTDGTSTIWAPNQLVHVVDPRYRLDDDLVVARVTLSKSAQSGTTTALELAYPDGLQPEPLKAKAYKAKSGGGHDFFAGVKY